MFVAGLLGEGLLSTRTIGALIEAVQAAGWPVHPFWAVAVDLESGRRVAFGRDDAPATDVAIPVNLMRERERPLVAQRALETTIAGLETRADWLPALLLLREAAEAFARRAGGDR